MTLTQPQIYLASRSPRRRELLAQIGIRFEELLPGTGMRHGDDDVDESVLPGEAAADYVARVACVKAALGWAGVQRRRLHARPVLAADTAVVLDGEILGKPRDAGHAAEMLTRLAGRTHEVLTAVAVKCGERTESALSVSRVEFAEIEAGEVRNYVAGGESLDKAGAYAIQGRAAVFVRAISGSYSGIVGLPLYESAALLRRFGVQPDAHDVRAA